MPIRIPFPRLFALHLAPDTLHLTPAFARSFVFINISGCTFIFWEQETGERRQKSGAGPAVPIRIPFPRPFALHLAPDTLHLTPAFVRSFVFMNISGCTFIFENRS